MKIYNEKDFINIIRDNATALTLEEFYETKQLSNLWDKFKEDDIRKIALKDKKSFFDWCYNFIHNDQPLKYYFNKRLSYKEPVSVNILPVVDKRIKNTPNNVRFIRNINLESMLDSCGFDGESIKKAYKLSLESGKVNRFITMPSVFKDSYKQDYGSYAVTMKTITGQMSVFSPSVYKTLLKICNNYIDKNIKKKKMLIPSASWCSPVLAIDSDDYSEVHIVDVQKKVLDKCNEVFDLLYKNTLFEACDYKLKTFTTQSEIMSNVVDSDYDKIFFCPPYYDLELYGGSENQSTSLYDSYDKWLKNYWKETVKESHKVLNTEGIFSFVMGRNIRSYMMAEDMKKIAEEYFDLVDEIKIIPPKEITRDNKHLNKYEICFIMKKK